MYTKEQKNKRLKNNEGTHKKLMFLCSYVKKENTHRNYVLLFLCPKERITLLNHTFSSVQSAISNSSTSVLSR